MLTLFATLAVMQYDAAAAASDRDDMSVSSDAAPQTSVSLADKSKQAATVREPAGGRSAPTSQSTAGESCGKPQTVTRGSVTTFPGMICQYATQADESVHFETLLWHTPQQADTQPAGKEEPAAGAKQAPEKLELRLRRLDLVDAQSKHLIPGDLTTAFTELPKETMPLPGRDPPVRVTFDVPLKDVKSGRYSGFVLGEWEQNESGKKPAFLLPLELHLRDAPYPAFGILIVGLVVSLWLQFYRDRRLKRDDLYTRAARAEDLALADAAIAHPSSDGEPFRRKLAQTLRNAVAAIDQGKVNEAETALGEGDTLWQRWMADRPTWVAGLRTAKQAIRAVERASSAFSAEPGRHATKLIEALKQHYNEAPTQANADVFRTTAETLARRASRYAAFSAELDAVRSRIARIPDEQRRTELIGQLDALQNEWEDVVDSSVSDVENLRAKLTIVLTDIATFAGAQAEVARARESVLSEDLPDEADDYLIPRRFRSRVVNARRARKQYGVIISVVIFLGLSVVGFQQTYLDNPIFGANPLADYLKVFAWALGADVASRASLLAFRADWPAWGRPAAPGVPQREAAPARRLPL
jgi:hypothetical protein